MHLEHGSGQPFADILRLVELMPRADDAAIAAVSARDAELTKPPGSLGRLEEIARWLAAWQRDPRPKADKVMMAIFATSHGVTAKGVSAFPAEVNAQMMANFTQGGAAINQICMSGDISLKVFDLAVSQPTPDITEAPAMDEPACAATIAYGMEAVEGGQHLLCLGEMGIGNTTIAAAIYHALWGGAARDWVGPGTGVSGEALERKVQAVEQAVARHKAAMTSPLNVLRCVGGREVAAMVGAILAARHEKVPVLLDGFVTTAAAAVLHAIDPAAISHCLAAHVSAEPAHRKVLDKLGLRPLLDLDMRLGEGSGAGVAVSVVRAAAATHNGMATFASAGVSGKG